MRLVVFWSFSISRSGCLFMTSLDRKALISCVVLTAAMALMIFGLAGTIDYWQAWLYLSVLLVVSILITLYLIKNDPALLKRRMSGGPTAETRPAQRIIMAFISLGFIALVVVPALDHRLGWSRVPTYIVIMGNMLVALGFYFIFLVYRENSFSAATIQVAADQTVISTGPYAVVRHPMYAGASFYLLGTPLALGSYWGLLAFVWILPFLIWRLFDEEHTLAQELPGYTEYQRRVRHRLIPMIW
jgi:protein-S-isoprenylcysteine O-methyltransferase Ste14